MLKTSDIRVVSITQEVTPGTNQRPSESFKVVFSRGMYLPEIAVFVQRTLPDEDIVRLARQYLHEQAKELAAATAAWKAEQL